MTSGFRTVVKVCVSFDDDKHLAGFRDSNVFYDTFGRCLTEYCVLLFLSPCINGFCCIFWSFFYWPCRFFVGRADDQDRVETFAKAQRAALTDTSIPIPGGFAGHTVSPMAVAGCYAPGGRYPLPSSVIMTAVTARLALQLALQLGLTRKG